MSNISADNQSISLKAQEKYIVIDPLYLDEIKENLDLLDKENLLKEIRQKVFEYTENPFIEYIPLSESFNLNLVSRASDSFTSNTKDVVCTDTGMLIFINENIFLSFISRFSYGELTDSLIDIINQVYWTELISLYEPYSVGLIIAPGTGFEFDGSGLFKISE